MASLQFTRLSLTRVGAGRFPEATGTVALNFLLIGRSLFCECPDERSQPAALLNGLCSPVPAPVVAVPGAARSTGAQTTMQSAPFTIDDRRALTGCPRPGLSAASQTWITMDQRPVSHRVDLQFFFPPPSRSRHRPQQPARGGRRNSLGSTRGRAAMLIRS